MVGPIIPERLFADNKGLQRIAPNPLLGQILHVNWLLHNACNNRCSYCAPINYEGSHDWLKLADATRFMTRVFEHYRKDIYHVSFTGGEPTIWPDFFRFCEYLWENKCEIGITTNASRNTDFWEKSKHFFNWVCISYHPEYDRDDHLLRVVELLRENCSLSVRLMMPQEKSLWKKSVDFGERLKQQNGVRIHVEYVVVQEGFGATDLKPAPYEAWQKEFFQGNMTFPAGDKHNTFFWKSPNVNNYWSQNNHGEYGWTSPADLVAHGQVNFKNWTCYAGIDGLFIDHRGSIFRATCHQGGKIGNIFDPNILFPKKAVICQKNYCPCGTDIQMHKLPIEYYEERSCEESWGFEFLSEDHELQLHLAIRPFIVAENPFYVQSPQDDAQKISEWSRQEEKRVLGYFCGDEPVGEAVLLEKEKGDILSAVELNLRVDEIGILLPIKKMVFRASFNPKTLAACALQKSFSVRSQQCLVFRAGEEVRLVAEEGGAALIIKAHKTLLPINSLLNSAREMSRLQTIEEVELLFIKHAFEVSDPAIDIIGQKLFKKYKETHSFFPEATALLSLSSNVEGHDSDYYYENRAMPETKILAVDVKYWAHALFFKRQYFNFIFIIPSNFSIMDAFDFYALFTKAVHQLKKKQEFGFTLRPIQDRVTTSDMLLVNRTACLREQQIPFSPHEFGRKLKPFPAEFASGFNLTNEG